MLKAALKLGFSAFGRRREPLTFGRNDDMLDFLMLMVFFPGIFRVTSSKYSDMFSTAFTPSSGDCCCCGMVELLQNLHNIQLKNKFMIENKQLLIYLNLV